MRYLATVVTLTPVTLTPTGATSTCGTWHYTPVGRACVVTHLPTGRSYREPCLAVARRATGDGTALRYLNTRTDRSTT